MTVKSCLLVTDDPDDHHAFSEALTEISEKTIVLVVLDSQKALDLINSQKHVPDYIFLDLSMHGIRINTFLKVMQADNKLHKIPTVVYGDEDSLKKVEYTDGVTFFNKEYEYNELRNFLKSFFSP